MNLQGNLGKLTDLLNFIIFDVIEPELTDAARERVHHMLQAGPPTNGETPAAETLKK